MRKLAFAAATAMVIGGASLHALAENGGAADRQTGGLSGSYDESRGGAYSAEMRLQMHRMRNSGSGANTGDGGSYSVSACCTFAPGGFPVGDRVVSTSLFELARGVEPEGIPVTQVPHFHGLVGAPTIAYSWGQAKRWWAW